jgi:hypothetical protein
MKILTSYLIVIFLSLSPFKLFANYVETIGDLPGVKYPDPTTEEGEPIITYADYKNLGDLDGYTDLIPYLLPSPNQEDAGSCLYMSHTGVVEWWMSYLNSRPMPKIEGEFDFSERYLMNIAGEKKYQDKVKNWRTDTIYVLNRAKYFLTNQAYPFTKQWYKTDKKGNRVKAKAKEQGAQYGTGVNWINDLNTVVDKQGVALPQFDRTILFADPEKNQWNTGITPEGIEEQIKDALRVNQAPVMVMYNHYGYWHIHMVVGYDDNASTDCRFTKGSASHLNKKSKEFYQMGKNETDEKKKQRLLNKAKNYAKYGNAAHATLKKMGGCPEKGVFYVRDSLYPDPSLPVYDFHTRSTNDDGNFTKKVILRSYAYVRALANHVFQIMPSE